MRPKIRPLIAWATFLTCWSVVTAPPPPTEEDREQEAQWNKQFGAGFSSTFIGKDQVTTCSVSEIASGSLKLCKFPFNFKGETFHSCTTITGKNEDGSFNYGNAWCSTNTDDNDNHIEGGSFYGDCERKNCPSMLDADWVSDGKPNYEKDDDGNYIIGDMVLTEQQYHQFYGDESKVIEDSGLKSERYRWPNGEIPYTFDRRVGRSDQAKIKRAISKFNSALSGCLTIRPKRSGESAYVNIINGGGCYSSVGRMGRKQDLSLATRGCTSEGTVAHEFIHAIGFHHEQNRPDRDKYVKINWHNIQGRMSHNFKIQRGSSDFGVKYDGLSIMHYFSTAFGGGRNTIEAKPGSGFTTRQLGRSKWIQKSDIQKLRNMYKCGGGGITKPDPKPGGGSKPHPTCKADNGKSCYFPFNYEGETYTKCTTADSPSGAWCATEVDSYGDVVRGSWADCRRGCPGTSGGRPDPPPSPPPVTGGRKCTTIGGRDPGKQCKFPFRFDGITYNSCTYAGNGAGETAAWCSTKVDSSGNHVGGQGKWGECPSSCSPQKTFNEG